MKILLIRTWITNIGNGFIDKGAKAALSRAFPNADIIESSGLSNKAKAQSNFGHYIRRIGESVPLIGDQLVEKGRNAVLDDVFSKETVTVSELTDADLAVFPGCVLDKHMDWYLETLIELKNRNIPILLLGNGGLNYSDNTVKHVRDNLKRVDPEGMITRDQAAYENYSSVVDRSFVGIDNGFFVNDWYTPATANQEFINITFDKKKEPSIDTDKKIVRPHHGPLTTPFSGITTEISYILLKKLRMNSSTFYNKPNTFISDLLEDYLFLYANGDETHTDRVHAAVPALAYGNKAQFHYKTPRAGLFSRVIDDDISDDLLEISQDRLKDEKERQVDILTEIVSEVI